MDKVQIAKICHEVNRAYAAALDDFDHQPWDDAPEWQKNSAIKGVEFHLANPNASPVDSHNSWLKAKESEGWTYGPWKDEAKKEHPCMMPFDDIPRAHQAKDFLFCTLIKELSQFLTPTAQ